MKNLQKEFENLLKGSCYAWCLCYKFTEADTFEMARFIIDGYERGYIESDGYVAKPTSFINNILCPGLEIKDVQKIEVNSLDDLPEDDVIFIVEFKLNKECNGSHFVCVQNRKVVFDPAGESNTVKFGIPTSIRKYINKI